MASVFSNALLTQVSLVLSGLALLQIVNSRERIQILPLIPYAWGTGSVLLYLAGGIFVRQEWLLHSWHLVIGGAMAALVITGAVIYLRRQTGRDEPVWVFPLPIRWYDTLIIALIVVKVSLVAYICMVNSVTDSDATDMRRYVALAKKIGEGVRLSEVLEQGSGHHASIGPSVLSAWSRMFLDRWHDSVASLPWLLAWLFSGYASFVICYRLTRHFTAALVCVYLFLSIPLAATHVFRSGFHDLFVMYFFIVGIAPLSLAFLSREKPDSAWPTLTITALLGLMLCKSEGTIWALFLVVMWLNYYLHNYRNIRWTRLIVVQMSIAGILLLIYYFALDGKFFNSLSDGRLRLLAPHPFEEEAFAATIKQMFLMGSFGIWWWVVVSTGIYFLLPGKTPGNIRLMAFFTLSILLTVIFFANFTENIKFTLNGTNFNRFLLQLTGLLIPLYCALILPWAPTDTTRSAPPPGGKKWSR